MVWSATPSFMISWSFSAIFRWSYVLSCVPERHTARKIVADVPLYRPDRTCVAVCVSVLQRVAICCLYTDPIVPVLQCVVVCCSVLQCVAECCSVLQCAAVCCSVLQCVAVCCIALQSIASTQTVPPLFEPRLQRRLRCQCIVVFVPYGDQRDRSHLQQVVMTPPVTSYGQHQWGSKWRCLWRP